jgi:hypothetical protein
MVSSGMKQIRRVAIPVLILAAPVAPHAASAAMVVNTGSSPYVGAQYPGFSIANYQDLAAEFTTSQAYDITSLSAFMLNYACCGPITSSFHLGLAAGPTDPTDATFTNLFSLPVSVTSESGVAGWVSTTVPNYMLPAGTWWIVVSTTISDDPTGLGLPGGVPNPLPAYAYSFGLSNSGWQPITGSIGGTDIPSTFGFQVEGEPTNPVPLPGTLGLLASGVGAFAAVRRRGRRGSK